MADIHTHTYYSHGKGSVEDNVIAARARGIETLGISDHGPGHIAFGVRRRKFKEQKEEIIGLRKKYPDMKILFGIEANIDGLDGKLDISTEEAEFFDFVCAGWHYGSLGGMTPSGMATTLTNFIRNTPRRASEKQIKRNTESIVRALEHNNILFLTHPGDKAPVDLEEIAKACARTDTLVEINTSHMSLSAEDIRMMAGGGARFIIGSDAHTPARIGDFGPAVKLTTEAGIDIDCIARIDVEQKGV